MARGWHTQEPASQEAIPLEGGKKTLQRYYSGARMESPLGGTLHLLRIRPEEDGSGTVLFECSASSLRFALTIPKASRKDLAAVKEQQKAGREPFCPRHTDPPEKLVRSGGHYLCPLCGVRYGKPI